jgi:Tfp pilus assembly protein PilO
MSYIADKLEEMDGYFEQKKESEKWVLIALFAGAVAFFVYIFFFDDAKNAYEQSVRNHKSINKKIHEEKTYLNSISRNGDRTYKVKVYDQEIVTKKQSVKSYNKRIDVINTNLNKLSDLLFNQKSWSLFLDSITERASSNGIQINSLQNKYVDNNGSFGHVLEIGLQCEGNFENIIQFINDIEQNTLVTDIYSSNIHSDMNSSTIISDINISVWGVNH